MRIRYNMGQLDNLLKNFADQLAQDSQKREVKKAVGDQAMTSMLIRIRTGQGVSSLDGESIQPVKLAALGAFATPENAEAYLKRRASMRARGELSANANVRFSNATATGQMLDAMRMRVTNSGFDLEIEPSRRRDTGKVNNAQVASYYESLRPFFAFHDGERRILNASFRDKLRKLAVERARKYRTR